MAGFLKNKILGEIQSIAQMGSQNGGPNNFYDPGMAPIAQQVSPEDLLQQQLVESGRSIAQNLPKQQPYIPPDYDWQAANSLPTYGAKGAMIGPNENYSDPSDPKSTAYALTQGINHLATGSLSARQNQKFQRGEAAQNLVRNFLAPLAGAFGPAGAAAGIKDYMKTSGEQAVKAKELKLKEQSDAITQMKTMADMLAKNTPYTKDSLEMIIKRATAEQQIKNQMAQQSAAEQRARASNVEQSDHAAGTLQKLAGIMDKNAAANLKNTKSAGEAAKTELTGQKTKTEEKKTETQGATTSLRNKQADLAASRAAKVNKEAAQVDPLAASKIEMNNASAAHQTAAAAWAEAQTKTKKKGEYHEGPITPADKAEVMKSVAPGQMDKFEQAYAATMKHKGMVSMADLIKFKNMTDWAHEQEKAALKGKGGGAPPPLSMSFIKSKPRL